MRLLDRAHLQLEAGRPVPLKVLSTPPEARVFIDGDEVGTKLFGCATSA